MKLSLVFKARDGAAQRGGGRGPSPRLPQAPRVPPEERLLQVPRVTGGVRAAITRGNWEIGAAVPACGVPSAGFLPLFWPTVSTPGGQEPRFPSAVSAVQCEVLQLGAQ